MEFDLVHHFKIERSARSVVFVGRNPETKEKHFFLVDDFDPYFGVPWAERNTHKGHYNVVNITESQDIHGNKLAKITVKRADNVHIMSQDYSRTYENKTYFEERVKIDLGIKAGFTIPDNFMRGKCFAKTCGGKLYHRVPYATIQGW